MRKTATVKKICRNCHQEFMVERYRAKKAKYCSTKCNLIVVNKNNPKRGTFVKCKVCGKEIYQRPKGKRVVCSKKCLGIYFSKARKGIRLNSGRTLMKKGNVPWNKGKHTGITPWLGKKRPDMIGNTHGFTSENMSKEKHPAWKGGITPQTLIDRANFRRTIQKEVLRRDNYTCQMCGVSGGYLHVDHIQSWSEFEEGRFDINNCRTLCRECHYFITFGKRIPEDSTWGIFNKKGGDSYAFELHRHLK